jgi:hypothetical protein
VATGVGFGDGVGGFGFGVDDVSTQLASASAASHPTLDSLRSVFRDCWLKVGLGRLPQLKIPRN